MSLLPPRRVYSSALALVCLSVLIAVLYRPPTSTHAATTYTVNSLADTPDLVINGICEDINGACTFRAAIMEANVQQGDETIQFSVTGTINLTGELQALQSNMNIVGPGSGSLTLRRDSGGNYGVLATTATITISGITITNGRTPDGNLDNVAQGGGGTCKRKAI